MQLAVGKEPLMEAAKIALFVNKRLKNKESLGTGRRDGYMFQIACCQSNLGQKK